MCQINLFTRFPLFVLAADSRLGGPAPAILVEDEVFAACAFCDFLADFFLAAVSAIAGVEVAVSVAVDFEITGVAGGVNILETELPEESSAAFVAANASPDFFVVFFLDLGVFGFPLGFDFDFRGDSSSSPPFSTPFSFSAGAAWSSSEAASISLPTYL